MGVLRPQHSFNPAPAYPRSQPFPRRRERWHCYHSHHHWSPRDREADRPTAGARASARNSAEEERAEARSSTN